MVKSPVTAKVRPYGARILHVMDVCGYEKKSWLADALGIKAQKLNNWIGRDKPGTGAPELKKLTGVSIDWLLSGDGVAFPKGPILYAGPGSADQALEINRHRNDIDALRTVVTALVEALIVTTPNVAAGLERLLAKAEPRFLGKGYVGQIQEAAAAARQTLAAAPPSSRPRAAGGSSRRGSAS